MRQFIAVIMLSLLPFLSLAQEAAQEVPQVQTSWTGLIGFLVISIAAIVATIWMILFKKDDKPKGEEEKK